MSRQQNSRRVRNKPEGQIHVTGSFRFKGDAQGGEKNPYAFMGDSKYKGDFGRKETKEGLSKKIQSDRHLNNFFRENNTESHIKKTVGSKELNYYQFNDPAKLAELKHQPRPKYVETDPRRMKTTKVQANPYKVGATNANDMFKKQGKPIVQEPKVVDKDYAKKAQNLQKNKVQANLIKMQNNVTHNLKGKDANLNNQGHRPARQLPTYQHNRLW